jgi:hypothetical protein
VSFLHNEEFDFNGGKFACAWQKVSSIEGKLDCAFGEEKCSLFLIFI